MATIYDIKPTFQKLLRPIVEKLASLNVTPNQVTVAACVISILFGSLMAVMPHNTAILWFLPVILFIRMALNAIDGILAKEFNMQSSLGAILNELTDMNSDVA